MSLEKIVSILFHPVFVPTITVFLIVKIYSNIIILENQAGIILIGTCVFSLILPLFSVFILLLTKKIDSLEMPKKEERFLPILFASIWMILGFYFMKEIFSYAPIMKSIHLGAIYVMLISLLITKKWKISLHMLAIGGATGVFIMLEFLFGQNLMLLLITILISGILGFSRLSLKAHSLNQIYAGFIVGNIVMGLSILYL
jgi:membrane-associated phospholipid phosphatase